VHISNPTHKLLKDYLAQFFIHSLLRKLLHVMIDWHSSTKFHH
jgi:hypothetical protein